MGVVGIGVDVAYIPRIAALMKRRTAGRLAARILSDRELLDWGKIQTEDELRQIRFLAVRWSMKEAAYKALYPLARPTWKDFTYRSLDKLCGQKPSLCYHPTISPRSYRFHASASHDGDYVFTTVFIEDY